MSSDPTLPRRKTTQLPSHLLSLLHRLPARPSRPPRLGGEPALHMAGLTLHRSTAGSSMVGQVRPC